MVNRNRQIIGLAIIIIVPILVYNFFQSNKLSWFLPSKQPRMYSNVEKMEFNSFSVGLTPSLNPERGWWKLYYSHGSLNGLKNERANGVSLILLEVNLGEFLNGPISDAKLKEIQNALDAIRNNNLSVIFRAAYDYVGKDKPEPANLDVLLNHIRQLKKIWFDNEDILYLVQAGFIGRWGEWHGSIYGNPIPLDVQTKVVNTMLESTPKSVFIQLRRPMFVRGIFPGKTLTDTEAFTGTSFSRVGYYNDALLTTADDYGTYVDKGYNRALELAWANNHCKYTPFVAESNTLTNLSDPDNAVYELGLLHAQSLNVSYHPEVIKKWKTTTYKGINTHEYITRHLGYNFVLKEVAFNSTINVGQHLNIKFSIQNTGFGNLLKEKDFEVILTKGTKIYRAKVNEDARRWYKEKGVITLDLYFSLPKNMEVGDWQVNFKLSNPAPRLKDNPAYSIKFDNENLWQATTGYNLVGTIKVTNTNPGMNTEFKQTTKPAEPENTLIITTTSLPGATVGNNYQAQLVSFGGSGTKSWSATMLPPGLNINSLGAISGTPTIGGTYNVTITVKDSKNVSVSKSFILMVNYPPLVINTLLLVNGQVGVNYYQAISSTGGAGNYTYSATGLPDGLAISNTGIITGTPKVYGMFTVKVTVKDTNTTSISKAFSLSIKQGVTITPLQIINTIPSSGATNVDVSEAIQIIFNQNISIGDANAYSAIVIKDTTNKLMLFKKTVNGNTLTITPNSKLNDNTQYTIIIPKDGIKSSNSAVTLSNSFEFKFTTKSNISSSGITVNNDKTNLTFIITGNDLNKKSQLFIDIDNKGTTGYIYHWSKAGFEYLIENSTLYKYSGKNNAWGWTKVVDVSVDKSTNQIKIIVPLNRLDLTTGSTIAYGFISNDNLTTPYPLSKNDSLPTYKIK